MVAKGTIFFHKALKIYYNYLALMIMLGIVNRVDLLVRKKLIKMTTMVIFLVH